MSEVTKRFLRPRVDEPGVPLSRPEPREKKKRGLSRTTPLKQRNEARAKKASAENFGPCSNMARLLGCIVPSCFRRPRDGVVELEPRWTIQAAHVRSRGSGGKDWGNVVGLCVQHHAEQGSLGIESFQKRYGLDMEAAASRIASAVQEHECFAWRVARRCKVCRRRAA
jgi:hypothetical protein